MAPFRRFNSRACVLDSCVGERVEAAELQHRCRAWRHSAGFTSASACWTASGVRRGCITSTSHPPCGNAVVLSSPFAHAHGAYTPASCAAGSYVDPFSFPSSCPPTPSPLPAPLFPPPPHTCSLHCCIASRSSESVRLLFHDCSSGRRWHQQQGTAPGEAQLANVSLKANCLPTGGLQVVCCGWHVSSSQDQADAH